MVLPRRAVLASVEASARRLGESGVWLLALPSSYIAGVQVIVRSLVAGHEPIVVDGLDVGRASASDHTTTPAFVSLVPTQLHRIMANPDQLAALAHCHTVLVGGAGLDHDERGRAQEAGVNIVATYGSSETAGGCVYDGRPLDGVAVTLGAGGRVRMAGPTMFSHYENDPELTAESVVDGWFLTSDEGRFAEDGRLEIIGRIDDVVISGGVKIPLSAVADRLRQHLQIEQAEVFGLPDARVGPEARRRRRRHRQRRRAPRLDQHGPPPFVGAARVRPGRQPPAARQREGGPAGHPGRTLMPDVSTPVVFSIPLRIRFRGITLREGVLLRGPAGLGRVVALPRVRRRDRASVVGVCARGRRPGLAGAAARPRAGQRHRSGDGPRARARDRGRRRLPHRQGEGRRARSGPRRRPRPGRGRP